MARRRISAYGPVLLPVLKAELISLFPQLGRRGITDGIERGLPASVWQTSVHAPGLKTPENRAATRLARLSVLPSPSHNKVIGGHSGPLLTDSLQV